MIKNNIVAFLAYGVICFFSPFIFGAGEPGMLRYLPELGIPNVYELYSLTLVLIIFFLCFLIGTRLTPLSSKRKNILSVSGVSFFAIVVLIINNFKFQVWNIIYAYPFLPIWWVYEKNDYILAVEILLILLPTLLFWSGIEFRRNKRTFIKVNLPVIVVILIFWSFTMGIGVLKSIHTYKVKTNTVFVQTLEIDKELPKEQLIAIYGSLYNNKNEPQDYTTIENEKKKQEFEVIYGSSLPNIDFNNYYYAVARGSRVDYINGYITKQQKIDESITVIYKVNIVH